MKPYPQPFEEYWQTTATRNGMRLGKRATFKEWEKAISQGAYPDDLLRASKAYAQHCEKNELFAKDPERFIRQGIWEDFAEIPEPPQFVTVSKEVARAYLIHAGREKWLKKLDSEYAPSWLFVVPKEFAEQHG